MSGHLGREDARARLAVLTGEQRAGKTTAARRVVELARERGLDCGGFLSLDVVDSAGRKSGIELVSQSDGARRPLAVVGDGLDGPRVGPYSFDQSTLDWGVGLFREAIASERGLVAADELGRLEFERDAGFAPILSDLAAGRYRRALVVGRLGLCERLCDLGPKIDVALFHLTATPESRAAVPAVVLDWLLGESVGR